MYTYSTNVPTHKWAISCFCKSIWNRLVIMFYCTSALHALYKPNTDFWSILNTFQLRFEYDIQYILLKFCPENGLQWLEFNWTYIFHIFKEFIFSPWPKGEQHLLLSHYWNIIFFHFIKIYNKKHPWKKSQSLDWS